MMKFGIVGMILMAVLFAEPAVAQSAKQYLKAGEDFAKANNYTDAIDQFTRAIDLDPDNDKAYLQRGIAYTRLGEHKLAAEDYDRALVFDGNNAELYYFSGNEWHQYGDNPLALKKLTAALTLKRNFLEAYQVRLKVHMALGQYREALEDAQRCLKMKDDDRAYYNLAQVFEELQMYSDAKEAYQQSLKKNDRILEPHFSYAKLLFQMEDYEAAEKEVAEVLKMEPQHFEGVLLQSQVYAAQGKYLKASETLSMASVKYSNEPLIYIYRGDINLKLNQPAYAVIDYSKAIELDPENADNYFKRAGAYEETRDYEKALADYKKVLEMSAYNGAAQRLHDEVSQRLFEMNREENKPRVVLLDPRSNDDNTINVSREVDRLNISGMISEESDIQSLQVNGFSVPVEKTEEGYRFLASVNLARSNQVTVQVSDIYDNTETAIFPIRRTEIDAPIVKMIAPYGNENHILYLDNNDPLIYVEGKIEDESRITSIFIDSVMASYIPTDLNPNFTAILNVSNKSRITVYAEDEFGNRAEIEYKLNRDSQAIENNPMGKTWAIFIENSDYDSFTDLEGPARDVSLMRSALANYQIQEAHLGPRLPPKGM